MERSMEEVSIRAPTVIYTLASLRITRKKAMVSRSGLLDLLMRVTGMLTRWMVRALSSGRKGISIKANTRMDSEMEKELNYGLQELSTL